MPSEEAEGPQVAGGGMPPIPEPAPARSPVLDSGEPEELRLHPFSPLFNLLAELRGWLIPGLVAIFGANAAGFAWQALGLLFLIPQLLASIVRYFRFRYRFDPTELVIRSGLVSRQERHIPYGRIQSVDAVQKLYHRPFGVVEVRLETGGGAEEPEAALRVLSIAAYEQMRQRVGAARRAPGTAQLAPGAEKAGEEGPDAGRVILALSPRELLLSGLIENRGFILLAILFGLYWESQWMGFDPPTPDWKGKGEIVGGLKDLLPSWGQVGGWFGGRIGFGIAAIVAFVLLLRPVSALWALVRLYGFRLRREGDVLRTEHGLLTRVLASIPLHRIQAITVHEGPLHRLFGRVSVKVETAGGGGKEGGSGEGGEGESARREKLAPILRRTELPALLRELLPTIEYPAVDWRPPAPRAFRRELKSGLILAFVLSIPFFPFLGWKGLGALAALVAWFSLRARQTVRHLGWAVDGDAVLYRSGWLWRKVTLAPLAKVQAVEMRDSPFDRRAGMSRVRVDTAGAGSASHRVEIPYLTRETARALFELLAGRVARSAFRW